MTSPPSSTRAAGWPRWPPYWTPATPEDRSPTTRCARGPPVRLPARADAGHGAGRDDRDRRSWPGSPGAGAGRADEAGLRDVPRRGSSCWWTPAGRFVLPEVPAIRLAIDEHAAQGRLHALPGGAGPPQTNGPDLVLRLAALLRDVGSGRPARRAGRLPPPRGRRGQDRAPPAARAALSEGHRRRSASSCSCACASTATAPGIDRLGRTLRDDTGHCWTAGRVRPFGLHEPRRRRTTLQRSYDSLEERIAALQAKDGSRPSAPDLDGDAIVRLRDRRGRWSGGLQHLLALRMEHGR